MQLHNFFVCVFIIHLQLKTQINSQQNCPKTLFQDITSVLAAASAEKKVNEVEIQAGLLYGRLKPLKILEENLSRNISEIKELINQARKQAASVSI